MAPHDPKTIALSLAVGILPALVWLWFWLREDKERPEPKGLLLFTFLIGMASVILVIPLQKLVAATVTGQGTQITLWAGLEEIMKYLVAFFIALGSRYADEPIDFPIYMMTAALGFAGFENVLFLLTPLGDHNTTVGLLTGNLRFLGSTLLHAVCSGLVGISLGLAFGGNKSERTTYLFFGLCGAIALHTVFNFFIIQDDGAQFFKVFGFLWVVSIISILLFEKLRRMSGARTA